MESEPKQPAERAASRVHYGFVILGLVVLAVFASLGLGRFGYTSILPAMQDRLGLSNVQTGTLQSWNLIGYLLTVVLAGMLSARYGPRVVIASSLLITALAMMLTGLFPWFENVRLGRFLAGVGGAGANVPAMALVSAWFGSRRRGLAAGAGVGGSSLGLMVTGPLVPLLLSRYGAEGWRVSWFVLGGLAFAVFVLCVIFLRNRPDELGLAPVGENESESLRRQAAQRAGVLDWSQVYRSSTLWHLAAIFFAFGFSYIIYSTFFIRYLVKEGGFTQSNAGLLWLNIGLISGISGFIWGSISDRWGRRLALVSVFLLQGTAFLILGLSRQLPVVYMSAGLFALTAWSVPALMAALAGDVFGARLASAALGLVTVIFGIGQALGPYLAGRIADATGSFSPAFLAAGAVALTLGAGGSWLLRPMKPST